MILIFSDSIDSSLDEVIRWINFHCVDVIRINNKDKIQIEEIVLESGKQTIIKFKVHSTIINFDDIDAIWFRKGVSFLHGFETCFFREYIEKNNELLEHLSAEWDSLLEYVFYQCITRKYVLGNYFTDSPNKLIVLQKAAHIGLMIPKTYITSLKKNLAHYNQQNLITKPIQDIYLRICGQKLYYSLTVEFNDDILELLGDNFFPSLVQNNIPKKYEVRTFFIGDQFYSMAIFSASDRMTRIDFRNYNFENPNRMVPYCLPRDIELKLLELTNVLHINTGSIDLIVTPSNDYIFLEINPVGLFGFLSTNCNYHIEKKIAYFLINEIDKFNEK